MWSIWIEGPTEELDSIRSVTYVLHPTFANPVRTIADRASNFKLKSQGWGIFVIRINVLNKDGSTIALEHELNLAYPQPPPDQRSQSGETVRTKGLTQNRVDLDEVQRDLRRLAQEYEDIRRSMPAGDPRTIKMTTIATKMRSLARPNFQLLDDLTNSYSAGDRLAAVAILEAIPNPSYLTWLADRIGTEKPFIAYHAACARCSMQPALCAQCMGMKFRRRLPGPSLTSTTGIGKIPIKSPC